MVSSSACRGMETLRRTCHTGEVAIGLLVPRGLWLMPQWWHRAPTVPLARRANRPAEAPVRPPAGTDPPPVGVPPPIEPADRQRSERSARAADTAARPVRRA